MIVVYEICISFDTCMHHIIHDTGITHLRYLWLKLTHVVSYDCQQRSYIQQYRNMTKQKSKFAYLTYKTNL